MTHTFRIRVNLAKSDRVVSDESKVSLSSDDASVELSLANPNSAEPLKEATRLVLVGAGYDSDADAQCAGDSYRNALLFALAKARVGVDFGAKGARGSLTKEGKAYFEQAYQVRILNDHIGLMTYETDPRPNFLGMEACLGIQKNATDLAREIVDARSASISFSDREYLALSFFNASFFQPEEEGRFVMLVMAVEALLSPEPRTPDALAHVNELIRSTANSDLPLEEKSSILGSLNWLKNESIGKTGQRLAAKKLAGRTYNDLTPQKFFRTCYEQRSRLVHGHTSLSELSEIPTLSAQLEIFVSDLLTAGKMP